MLRSHGPIAFFLVLVLSMASAGAAVTNAVLAEQRALDAETAAAMASHGQLLYDSDANKKSWGAYCAESQRLTDQGEFRRAIRAAQKALYLGQSQRNNAALAYAMRDLGYAYSFAGDLDRADEWSRRAIAASRQISNPSVDVSDEIVSPVEKTLGDVALRRGLFDEAMTHYAKALDAASMFSSQKALIRMAMAAAHLKRGQISQARELLKRESSGDSPLAAIARRGLGDAALAEGKPEEARKLFESAVRAARSSRNAYAELWSHYGLSRALRASGDNAAAQSSLQAALALAEQLRGGFRAEELKSGFFGDVQSVYDAAVELAARDGHAARALQISEQSRARAALDQLRGAAAASTPPVSPDEAAAALAADTSIVIYHVLPGEVIAWTLRRERISMARIARSARQVESDARELRRRLVHLDAAASDALGKLFQVYIAPLGLESRMVVFVPHRALHLMPLHAAMDKAEPILTRHAVGNALSLSAAVHSLQGGTSPDGPLVALGNPDLGDSQLDLPAAEVEVRSIARILGASEPYVRAAASAPVFRAQSLSAGILHVAAHATVDEVDPRFSTIRLAEGDVEAGDILKLDLRSTKLVAVSACSSGVGRVSGGDEFWGFKRSFLVAGARSLLVSLWPVADESTARLMEAFYKLRPQHGGAEALRRAQLEVRSEIRHAHPFFWAAFSLVGDWR